MTLSFKQTKPLTVKILGAFLFLIFIFFLLKYNAPFSQLIVLFILSFVLLGYSVSFEVSENFKNYRCIRLFGVLFFKQSMTIFFPDYITVFSASFSQNADWSSVAALGKERSNVFFVIKLFKDNKHFSIFKSTSYVDVDAKARELSEFLNVPYKAKAL